MFRSSLGLISHAAILAVPALTPVPAAAQSTAEAIHMRTQEAISGKSNWMYEFVTLRTQAMTDRAAGPAGPLPAFPEIVGGMDAGPDDNPFQVGLLTKNVADNFQAQFCGGSLIEPDVVVTAAHCSDFTTAGAVQVLTGTRKLDGSGTRHDVASIAIHPKWNPATFDYDVAVWKLATGTDGGPVATLAKEDGPVGEALLVTGWGTLSQGGPRPVDLQMVKVPLVAEATCNGPDSYSGQITARMICAGFEEGGRDSCQGDSGGPLTRGPDDGVLTGVVSWGRGCALPDLFGVYARVSDPEIRDFIDANK